MLIDVFMVCDETDMIDFRIRMLEPYVDRFIAVECDRTFSGKPKPFNFSADSFPAANGKFQHYAIQIQRQITWETPPASYDPSHPCWFIEREQRGAIVNALQGFADTDRVLLGDVDEIPSREALEMLKAQNFSGIASFRQFFFYYHLGCLRNEIWNGTVWCPVAAIRQFGAQELRDSRGMTGFAVDKAGWHLSYFGGTSAIQRKLRNFSHQEYNVPEFTDTGNIERRSAAGSDLFDRQITSGPPPENFFPEYFKGEVRQKEWWG